MRNDKMNGKVDYIVANGFTQFNNPAFANDISPYESFAGDNDAYDENFEFNDVPLEIEFSDASGRKKPTRRKKPARRGASVGQAMEKGQSRRDARRKDRQDLKREELKTQKEIAEQTLKAQDKDTTLLSQIGLANNANLPEVTTQKDNTTRNIIIIGSLAVATVVGIFIYKKYNK
jgi:hypothetical protein